MIRLTIILTLLLLISVINKGQQAINNGIITYTIAFAWLEGCETGKGDCNPVVLQRNSLQDSIKMIFPIGGTVSDVFLYTETDFVRWIRGAPKGEAQPLRHDGKRWGEGNPVLNLTGLTDGKYRACMLSCGLGGSFQVIITTQKK